MHTLLHISNITYFVSQVLLVVRIDVLIHQSKRDICLKTRCRRSSQFTEDKSS